jgi:hypothetical protein
MDKITQILENVVRCKYFEAGVHIKNPIKNSYQDSLGRTTQTLDRVVVVHILILDKRKSQINEYSDLHYLLDLDFEGGDKIVYVYYRGFYDELLTTLIGMKYIQIQSISLLERRLNQ